MLVPLSAVLAISRDEPVTVSDENGIT